MKPKAKRLLWILGVLCALALVVVWAFRIGKLSSYPFLSQMGGEERASTYDPVPMLSTLGPAKSSVDPNRDFLFTSPPDEVLAAMKRDLVAQGWTSVYADDEFATFSRKTKTGVDERAEFQTSMAKGDEHTCLVTVPRQSNWFEDLMQSLNDRLGRKTNLKSLDDWSGTPVNLDWDAKTDRKRAVVTITWRNRAETAMDVSVDEFLLHGYESDQVLPVKARVPAWHKAETVLTFPAEALSESKSLLHGYGGSEGDNKIQTSTYEVTGGTNGSTSTGGDVPLAPTAVIVGEKGSHKCSAVLENEAESRMLEIRNLEVWVGPNKVAAIPTRLVPARGIFRIPLWLQKSGKSGPKIVVKGEARLLPNKRWRKFRQEL